MNPAGAPPTLAALLAQEAEMIERIEIRRSIHAQPEIACCTTRGYDCNDGVWSTGASLWVRLAEPALPSTPTLR
jgi:hypothetical protein